MSGLFKVNDTKLVIALEKLAQTERIVSHKAFNQLLANREDRALLLQDIAALCSWRLEILFPSIHLPEYYKQCPPSSFRNHPVMTSRMENVRGWRKRYPRLKVR